MYIYNIYLLCIADKFNLLLINMYIIIVYIYVFCIADIHPIVTADRHLKRPSTEVSTVAMRQKNTSVMGTLWL